MKKESSVLYVLKLGLILLEVTGVIAGLLAAVNHITAPRIAAAQAEKTEKAIAAVLPGAAEPRQIELPEGTDGAIRAVYASDLGYAIEVHPNGFGGEITMMVGVDMEGKVTGVSIISHSETAGLGAVAAAKTAKGQAFRDQFIGQSGSPAVTKDGGNIDAIASATITSRAVTEGVSTALAWVRDNS